MLSYYHIISYKNEPAKGYGIAVNENGIVSTIPYDMSEVNWMVGKSIDFIKKFFEDKPAIIVSINDLIKPKNATTEH